MWLYFFIALISTLVLTVLFERWLIPRLKSKGMGQKILEIGPRWHKNKEGTPTMGGLAFIFASFIVMAIMIPAQYYAGKLENAVPVATTFIYALLNGLIGFADDYVKFFKKRNEGLTASQKYLLQLAVSALYLLALSLCGFFTTAVNIPFINIQVDLGIFNYILSLIILTGFVNSVNLTDGIDGLSSSVTFVVASFFAIVAFLLSDIALGTLSAVIIGSCVGFLVYNFYPARVFMGDTGSLFLGGMICGGAFLAKNPLILLIVGIIYLAESFSVILQVLYYKRTKKRLFKMAPIHHHFEKCGWNEIKIVLVFSICTVMFCIIGMISYLGWIR